MVMRSDFFFFNDTAATEIYTLSLHDALPISGSDRLGSRCYSAGMQARDFRSIGRAASEELRRRALVLIEQQGLSQGRSEEHTSELQSRQYLVCRLLLEKKK